MLFKVPKIIDTNKIVATIGSMVHLSIALKNAFFIKDLEVSISNYVTEETRIIKLYDSNITSITIPRYYGLSLLPELGRVTTVDNMSDGFPLSKDYPKINLRDDQLPFVKNILEAFKTKNDVIAQARTGCVDRDTEFLSTDGWKPIGDWNGEDVLQYDPILNRSTFVTPDEYIKLEAKTLWRFTTKYGLAQTLSDEHRVLYKDAWSGNLVTTNFVNIRRKHFNNVNGFTGSFLTTFTPTITTEFPLNEANLRVQIAVMADGYFGNKSNTVILRLKKQRKIDRIRKLLKDANIAYKEKLCNTVEGFHVFSFSAPLREKEYTIRWWKCSAAQLAIISNEVVFWDGNQKNQFYTSSKLSADFIQYAFTSIGKRASIHIQDRRGTYHYKSMEYTVAYTDRVWVGMTSSDTNTKCKITEVNTLDGFKYCFSVPSGYLVLRKDNNIFITGNSGKTVMALEIMRRLAGRTLVLVDQDSLVDQWIERAKQFLGIEDIGIAREGEFPEGKDLVIGMVQSLYNRKLPTSFTDQFKLLILDEVHSLGAENYHKVMTQFPARYRLGISATPDRRDALNRAIKAHLGPIAVSMESKHEQSYATIIDFPNVYEKEQSISKLPHKLHLAQRNNAERNSILVEAAYRMYGLNHDILMISESIEHLYIIQSMLKYRGIPEEEIQIIAGSGYIISARYQDKSSSNVTIDFFDSEGKDYTYFIEDKLIPKKKKIKIGSVQAKIILCTYKMFNKGVDVPRLSCGIELMSHEDIRQVHGRILRQKDGKNIPNWIMLREYKTQRLEFRLKSKLAYFLTEGNAKLYRWNPFTNESKYIKIPDMIKNIHININLLKSCDIATYITGESELIGMGSIRRVNAA